MLKRIRGRSFVVVIGIGCFALFLRLFLLDKIPAGISHDELDYVFNAKAVYLTGSDVTGTWNPLSLTTPPYEVPKAELPYLFIAPFIGPFNFSLFAARLPFVIANLLLILVIVAIAKKLFDSKTAIIAGLLMSINPWNIYFSRTSYDTPLAVLFYYVGMLLVLSLSGWPILLAVPFFAVAFFSYIGTKLVIVPLSTILLSYV
ncbi:glycosyltransferase family 39 protein, partial [Candidatus Roizmanbacteria bacterium]|nr:glycosyltransferase family 39 protein [Candidatus Roizmanbacteria bacterium]